MSELLQKAVTLERRARELLTRVECLRNDMRAMLIDNHDQKKHKHGRVIRIAR